MDLKKYLQDNSTPATDEVLGRIAKVIEQDPELALFGVSLASALDGDHMSMDQVLSCLAEVEERLSQT